MAPTHALRGGAAHEGSVGAALLQRRCCQIAEPQMPAATTRAISTAALAMSLARLDNSCRSKDTRSTTASMAEFSSSTMRMSSSDPSSSAACSQVLASQKASGAAMMHSQVSWRKALSPV